MRATPCRSGHPRRGLLDLDEFGLLAAVAGAHPDFGRPVVADAGTLALLVLAREELRPVADALVSAPAARRWWDPVARADQRFLEWADWPRLTGPAVQWAVRDSMTAARAENARGLALAQRHAARPATAGGRCGSRRRRRSGRSPARRTGRRW